MIEQTTTSFVSERAGQIQASITMAITALSNKLKKEGKPVIGMSAGEPDFDTPDAIKEAGKASIDQGKTKYTAASGIAELKEAIVKKLYKDNGLAYTTDQIIVSCGAKHSLFNAFMATLNPGDEVIIPSPYWVSYPAQVDVNGGVSVILETSDTSEFKITPEQLEAAITPRTKAVILNSPSNPTGVIYSKDELRALADVILKHPILVISDEIYEKLIYEGEHVSIASLGQDIKNRTIVVNGVSKAYSMTGWRIGYCAAPLEIAQAMNKIQSHSTSNPTVASQWASVEALDGSQEPVEEMKAAFSERRQYMVERLNNMPGVTCVEPKGAFYAFPNISSTFGKSCASGEITNAVDFCKHLLQEKLVACVPGSGFGAEGFIRLSYATSMDAIKEALDRIEEWLSGLN